MNNEPPPSNDPVPKIIWLLVILAPAALIMLATGGAAHGGDRAIRIVGLGLNPALTLSGCCMLLNRPGQNKVITILGGIFLGAFFAVFNLFLGTLLGCSLSGQHF